MKEVNFTFIFGVFLVSVICFLFGVNFARIFMTKDAELIDRALFIRAAHYEVVNKSSDRVKLRWDNEDIKYIVTGSSGNE